MTVEFTWDPRKAQSNLRKHGISFETAILAFDDPNQINRLERHVDGEERWQLLGLVKGQLMLLVIHTMWNEGELEVIRIISARKAEKHEEADYA
jgi:uncharacterized DUF497 family protein